MKMSEDPSTESKSKVSLAEIYAAQRQAVIEFSVAPRDLTGRGIVTSAYDREFASCWVLLSELARLNVKLPVEAWSLPGELSERQGKILLSLPLDLRLRVLEGNVTGWASKPFFIWGSAFREVMWLDADNAPLQDPTFLFSDPEYLRAGSLFWRDVSGVERANLWHKNAPVWKVFNVPYNDAEEFETGQLLIDKARCWPELGLTLHFNRYSNLYHRFVLGDKDTFRLAWQHLAYARTGKIRQRMYLAEPALVPYGFMPYGPFHLGVPNSAHKWGGGTVMTQRDRSGRPLFNHRNIGKFRLNEHNVFNEDVPNERIYHAHVAALQRLLVPDVCP